MLDYNSVLSISIQCLKLYPKPETRTLFHVFAQDNDIVIDDAVIKDVWAKSNGYIAQLNSLS